MVRVHINGGVFSALRAAGQFGVKETEPLFIKLVYDRGYLVRERVLKVFEGESEVRENLGGEMRRMIKEQSINGL